MQFLFYLPYIRYTLFPLFFILTLTLALSAAIIITPSLTKILYDKIFITFDILLLYKYTGIQLFVLLYTVILTLFQTIFEADMTIKIGNKIKVKSLTRLSKTKYLFFTNNESGSLMKRIVEDTSIVGEGISKFVLILCNSIMLVFFLFFLKSIDLWLYRFYLLIILLSIGWILLWIFPINYFNQKIGNGYSQIYGIMWEVLQGIKEIKAHNMYELLSRKISKNSDQLKNSFLFNSTFNTILWQFYGTFYTVIYIGILVFGIHKIEKGQLSVGILMGLFSIIFIILDPIQKIFSSISFVQSGFVAAKRLSIIRKSPLEKKSKLKLQPLRKGIVIKNLSYTYAKDKGDVLKNINAVIPCGSRVTFVGKTGSGKSTLMNLLTKILDDYRGSILFDDCELKNIDSINLRMKVSYISQEAIILNDSIRNNIDFYGKLDDYKLSNILKLVNLEPLIARLDKGIDTILGTGGINISGGEKQRISLARCFTLDPELIILDEMTSALDPENEQVIIRNILNYFQGKTVISISHKLSILKDFDNIYVLKDGEVVESGNFHHLSNHGNEFRNLFVF